MITVARRNFPAITPVEFRPGVDTVLLEWDAAFGTGYLKIEFSIDGGTLWDDVTPGGSPKTISGVNEDELTASYSAPRIYTDDGIFRVTVYDNIAMDESDIIFQDSSAKVVMAAWPDGYIKSTFPERYTIQDMGDRGLVLIGLGEKSLVPPAYLFRVENQNMLDTIFPPHTSVAKAWRMAIQSEDIDIYVMRAGDINEYKALNPKSPKAFRYLYEALVPCYLKLALTSAAVVCPVDAVTDLGDVGLDNMLGIQLAEFCEDQTNYASPTFGVIPAVTVEREQYLNQIFNRVEPWGDTPSPVRLSELRGGPSLGYNNALLNGVSLLNVESGTKPGLGLLSFEVATGKLKWAEPSDTYGTEVQIAIGGMFTLHSQNGKALHVNIEGLPAADQIVEVLIGRFDPYTASKFVMPIYGHTNITYNDHISGLLRSEQMTVAPSIAGMLSAISEGADPLNEPLRGLDAGAPALYESFITLLESGGVAATRKTITQGWTCGKGITAAPATIAEKRNGWAKVKNVRIIGEMMRACRALVEDKFLGENMKEASLERALNAVCDEFVGQTVESKNLSAVRSGTYSMETRLTVRPIGTIEDLTTTFSMGV